MAAIVCPHCAALQRRLVDVEEFVRQQQAVIQEQQALIRDLQAKLGQNASNSSMPPSANPLGAPKPVVKKKSKRKPGGQPGHPPRLKQLLPPERVKDVIAFVPEQCQHCHAALPTQPGPNDPEPTRFQVIELPQVVAEVTEYQGQARTCPCCGEVTRAVIPPALREHSVGPGLTAALSYFSGCHGLSKRAVEEIADNVFAAPLALGTVVNLEQEVGAALTLAHEEALRAVREAAVKHADETSWKLAGQLRWLWAAAAVGVAVFVIHARRNAAGLTALLGEQIHGILCSDRWGVYRRVAAACRQICWAHLKRDFRKIVDRGGPSQAVGRAGLCIVKKVFAAWHAFQDGQVTRAQLQAQLDPVVGRLNRVLLEGALLGEDKTVATFCENVLALEPALWTFLTTAGVEPTNNFMERLLRRAVLWRKRSFGCWSQAGCRFVERILTVVQTRRLQGQNVLEYLHDAVLAHRSGQPCPKLLPDS
jgi:transposase